MSSFKKRKTEITIETHQFTVLRVRAKTIRFNCPLCRIETVSLSPFQAAFAFRLTAQELQNLLQKNLIHRSSASPDDYCGGSLAGYFKKEIQIIEE